jgi:hypothetical protein
MCCSEISKVDQINLSIFILRKKFIRATCDSVIFVLIDECKACCVCADEERDGILVMPSSSSSNSAPILIGLRCGQRSRRHERSSEDSDLDHMELEQGSEGESVEASSGSGAFHTPATPTTVLNALNMLSLPRKLRCSSSTSADTADTSGFGSFGEEPPLSIEDAPRKDHGTNGRRNGKSREEGEASTDDDEEERGEGGSGSATERVAEGPTLGQLMKQRIDLLPLPLALRSFLTYYRK